MSDERTEPEWYWKLQHFAELEEGWDSYGADAISERAVKAAERFCRSMGVYPTKDGGVSVSFADEGVDVEFGADGTVVNVNVFIRDTNRFVTPSGVLDEVGTT